MPRRTELPRRYDITITVDRDGGDCPNPAEFAVATGQVASARAARIVSVHTASQIISMVTVLAQTREARSGHTRSIPDGGVAVPLCCTTALRVLITQTSVNV